MNSKYTMRRKSLLMSIFDKRPNSRRSPIIREVEGKRNMKCKSELLNLMSQHDRNDSQQACERNKR